MGSLRRSGREPRNAQVVLVEQDTGKETDRLRDEEGVLLEVQPQEEEEEPLDAGSEEHQENNPTGEKEEGREAELLWALAEAEE